MNFIKPCDNNLSSSQHLSQEANVNKGGKGYK